jgi:hypothetical protein
MVGGQVLPLGEKSFGGQMSPRTGLNSLSVASVKVMLSLVQNYIVAAIS